MAEAEAEKDRKTRKKTNMKVDFDIKTTSNRGLKISEDVPTSGGDVDRIKHYNLKIREYNFNDYPEEWALSQYYLACIYYADKNGDVFNNSNKKQSSAAKDGRAKAIESALFHLDKCTEVSFSKTDK